MKIQRIRPIPALLGATLVAGMLVTQPAAANGFGTKVERVDCSSRNASIQSAIDKVVPQRPVTVFVRGTCTEHVVIERDDVTVSGNGDGDDTIDGRLIGSVTVRGARRVRVEYMHITGPGSGVRLTDGAVATVAQSELIDNESDGVTVASFSFARVEYNVITGNGRPAPFFEAGIDVYVNGTVRSKGNFISGNHYSAVEVGNMSYFRSGLNTLGAPPDPADRDIILQKGCTQGQTAGTCGDSGTNAVECYRNGVCDIRDSDITGDIQLSGLSNFDVRSSVVINGNIYASGGTRVHTRFGISGSGHLSCFWPAFATGPVFCGGHIPPAP